MPVKDAKSSLKILGVLKTKTPKSTKTPKTPHIFGGSEITTSRSLIGLDTKSRFFQDF